MSNLLAYESYLVDIGTSVADWQLQFKTTMTDNGWQVFNEDGTVLELIPPVGQSIGNTIGYQILRVTFTTTSIEFAPVMVPLFNELYQSRYYFSQSGAYNGEQYWPSVTIEGDEFQVNTDGMNDVQRTQALYDYIMGLNWSNYPNSLAKLEGITFVAKGSDPSFPSYAYILFESYEDLDITATSGHSFGVTAGIRDGCKSGVPAENSDTLGYTVSVDFATGFIYYMSIFDRSIAFATKTTASYYGPITATWIDNAIVNQQTPDSMIPAELFIVNSQAFQSTDFRNVPARTSHAIGHAFMNNSQYNYSNTATAFATDIIANYGIDDGDPRVDQYLHLRQAAAKQNTNDNYHIVVKAWAGGITMNGIYNLTLGKTYEIVNVELPRTAHGQSQTTYGWSGETPSSFLEDVYVYTGTAVNESLHLSRIVDLATTISVAVEAVDTTINVADTTLFPASGSAIIGSEIIQYTGKTATSLTGVTRGMYGTTAIAYAVGESIYGSRWFVKINDGAIMAGYTKPTAS